MASQMQVVGNEDLLNGDESQDAPDFDTNKRFPVVKFNAHPSAGRRHSMATANVLVVPHKWRFEEVRIWCIVLFLLFCDSRLSCWLVVVFCLAQVLRFDLFDPFSFVICTRRDARTTPVQSIPFFLRGVPKFRCD